MLSHGIINASHVTGQLSSIDGVTDAIDVQVAKIKGDLEQEIVIISQIHVINVQRLRDLDCENIHSWISLSGDLVFSHQQGIHGFKFPKRYFGDLFQRSHFFSSSANLKT
jgi:hypothetical protein